ncbi:Uncharacterised protein [Mycobacterium tuberculosis]|nr:Uncharacterised protein [Mycobacterium tuberculosis]
MNKVLRSQNFQLTCKDNWWLYILPMINFLMVLLLKNLETTPKQGQNGLSIN